MSQIMQQQLFVQQQYMLLQQQLVLHGGGLQGSPTLQRNSSTTTTSVACAMCHLAVASHEVTQVGQKFVCQPCYVQLVELQKQRATAKIM